MLMIFDVIAEGISRKADAANSFSPNNMWRYQWPPLRQDVTFHNVMPLGIRAEPAGAHTSHASFS